MGRRVDAVIEGRFRLRHRRPKVSPFRYQILPNKECGDDVGPEKPVDSASRPRGLICGIPHSLQEEVEPLRPALTSSGPVESVVVKTSMLFEEQAEVQNRLAQHPFGTKHESYEQPSDPAVAVKKRMDRLELG